MGKEVKKISSNLITAILYVVAGILFCVFRGAIVTGL